MIRTLAMAIALVLISLGNALCADKKITVVGTLNCGTLDCAIQTADGRNEPGFLPSSPEGKQIIAAFKKCQKCEFTGIVDDKWFVVKRVISIKCMK